MDQQQVVNVIVVEDLCYTLKSLNAGQKERCEFWLGKS